MNSGLTDHPATEAADCLPNERLPDKGEFDFRLTRTNRIRRRYEYRRIQAGGARVHTRNFLILIEHGRESVRRLGVTVTKKVGSAVGRNHVKRRVKEVFRQHRSLFPGSADVVVIAKRGAAEIDYAEMLGQFTRARHAMKKALGRHATVQSSPAQPSPVEPEQPGVSQPASKRPARGRPA